MQSKVGLIKGVTVATRNVRSLTGSLEGIMAEIPRLRLEVVALQECRHSRATAMSAERFAAMRGYSITFGAPQANVAAPRRSDPQLAPRPADRPQVGRPRRRGGGGAHPPQGEAAGDGGLGLRAPQPVPHGDPEQPVGGLDGMVKAIVATGHDAILLGDFNAEEVERPVATLLAHGIMRNATEEWDLGNDEAQSSGERRIGYALYRGSIEWVRSGVAPGPADLSLWWWTVADDTERRVRRGPRRRRPDDEKDGDQLEADFEAIWKEQRSENWQALHQGSVDDAWRILNAAAEDAHGCVQGPRRVRVPRPTMSIRQAREVPQTERERELKNLSRKNCSPATRGPPRQHRLRLRTCKIEAGQGDATIELAKHVDDLLDPAGGVGPQDGEDPRPHTHTTL